MCLVRLVKVEDYHYIAIISQSRFAMFPFQDDHDP